MYFRRISNIKFYIIPFAQCIAKVKQAQFCFKGKPNTSANEIVIKACSIEIRFGEAHIWKAEQVWINTNKITVFSSENSIPVCIYTFFIESPKQPVASYLKQFISENLRCLEPPHMEGYL